MTRLNTPITVICPSGVLNAESACSFEQQLVMASENSRADELVVDMSRVESLDNAGLVSFMSALNAAKPRFKQLSICAAPPSIRIVLELTQLDRLFNIVEPAPSTIAA
ncbi:MAG: STAS domain-containing protein [Cyanobacteria bacterium J06648_10]